MAAADRNRPATAHRAYDNGHGGITVQPAAQPPQPGATKLPAGITQNVALLDLQESMDDYVNGLNSGWYPNTAATRIAQRNLFARGLTGWTVRPARRIHATTPSTGLPTPVASASPGAPTSQPTASGPSQQCVNTAILDPATKTLSLRESSDLRVLMPVTRSSRSNCAPSPTTDTMAAGGPTT